MQIMELCAVFRTFKVVLIFRLIFLRHILDISILVSDDFNPTLMKAGGHWRVR